MLAKVKSMLRNTWNGSGCSGSKVLALVLRRTFRPLIPLALATGAKTVLLSMERKRHRCLFVAAKDLAVFSIGTAINLILINILINYRDCMSMRDLLDYLLEDNL